jgi:hypothetical protein
MLAHLPLTRLHLDLQTSETTPVPAYKGDMLRMALLWWLSEYWCPLPERCRHGCRRPDVCMYGRLCEPPVDPAWPRKILHLMGDAAPPAYALWDLGDRRRELAAGSQWSFELTLVGELALTQIPAIVAAVQQGAEQGMGRVRLRSRLRQVRTVHQPLEGVEQAQVLADEQPHDNEKVLTWQSYRLEELTLAYAQAQRWIRAQSAPIRAISLRYLSPVKIKERGRWVEEPQFRAVMRALVRRLRLLSVVHGTGEWPHAEWGPLLDLAETVQLEHDDTSYSGYTRYSKRAGRQEIEGFVGQAWYRGEDLRALLPALWLGQWLHIGKSYVLGNGRYVVEAVYR